MDAPVHGLLALVDEAAFDELPKGPRDGGLVPEVHREIEMVPVAEHAKPLELDAHHVYEPRGVIAAGAPEISHRHVALLRPELPVNLQFDRQSVTVVA